MLVLVALLRTIQHGKLCMEIFLLWEMTDPLHHQQRVILLGNKMERRIVPCDCLKRIRKVLFIVVGCNDYGAKSDVCGFSTSFHPSIGIAQMICSRIMNQNYKY
mmetsp:Transcript_10303/g.15327  ORF Transcript_10303/g.15327 Transcript_10303/m.15327 type:complete len:104 (+) Transcript_10303:2301-2612(+)